MAEITIGDNHRDHVARQQHVLEWLQSERARLETEMQHVLSAGQRVQGDLLGFIRQNYGLTGPIAAIDADRGVIVTPDAPAQADAPNTTEGDQSADVEPQGETTSERTEPIPLAGRAHAVHRRATDKTSI